MRALLAALALALAAATAQAGRPCEARPPSVQAVVQSLELADRTRRALDASGAQVVLLARAGQDLTRYGLQWSHLGWAYRDTDGWRVLHKLNTCHSATASLYRQGLGEFFMDDPWQYRGAFLVPAPAVQQRLWPLLRDNTQAARLHTQAYNMVAYPWSTRYQQSNQWALEMLAMAEEAGITTRDQAQAWLRFKGYRPTELRLGTLTRLGARVSGAHIAFDDHPNSQRFAGRIETVTVDSIFDWMPRAGLGGGAQGVW